MKKKLLLLILSIFLISCGENNFSTEKELKLSDGKMVKVFWEEKELRKNEKILVINYQIDEKTLKEKTIENQVLEIWKNFEAEADQRNLTEAIITAKYFIGHAEKSNQKIYQDFFYETEKIENGTWKIRKVN